MQKKESLAIAEAWQKHMRACDTQMHALDSLVGSRPDAPLQDAVARLQGEYTRAVADLLGIGAEWLVAWWTEHDLGGRPMQAGLVGEPLRTITTLAELLELALDDSNCKKPKRRAAQ